MTPTSTIAEIPPDVMAAAIRALHSDDWDTPGLVIARAILDERERCAKVAGDCPSHWVPWIASHIRKGA